MIHIKIYKYGKREVEYLKKRDPKLGKEINRIGMIEREINSDIFSALISSIISQQISIKAASTVEARLVNLIGSISPENIKKIEIEDIQKCGMSTRKAEYIKEAAMAFISGAIDLKKIDELSDDEFIKEITKLKGVGIWTAEMLLIHSLEREDILSYSDLGIRKAIEKLYDINDLSKKQFKTFQERYAPYGTVASFYLWAISSEK